ncbi:MAG: hypothetical protein AAF490_24990 [Chloroflexota bacterium]
MNSTEDVATPQQNRNNWGIILPIVIIGVVAIFAFLFFRGLGNNNRLIKPFVPTQTPSALLVEYAPIALEFADLGEDPLQFSGQRVQITGRFSQIELPDCRPYSGPQIEWGLIHDALQMNAIGYESIVRSIPANTEMTVEGVWTFYDGGVGCGKESVVQNGIWYLKVEHILSPNPIVAVDSRFQTRSNVEGSVDSDQATPSVESTPIDDGAPVETVAPTVPANEESATPTTTPTPALNSTPTAIPATTAPNATATATATPNSEPTEEATSAPDSTETPVPTATATADSQATSTPPPTATVGSPGNPPAPTATPGDGYPPPGGGGYP